MPTSARKPAFVTAKQERGGLLRSVRMSAGRRERVINFDTAACSRATTSGRWIAAERSAVSWFIDGDARSAEGKASHERWSVRQHAVFGGLRPRRDREPPPGGVGRRRERPDDRRFGRGK